MANEKTLTPREQWEAMQAEKKAAIDARIEAEIAAGFLNPFGEGVGYDKFLSVIPKGVSVREYLTGKLPVDSTAQDWPKREKELIDWIENDLSHYAPYQDFLSKLEAKKSK